VPNAIAGKQHASVPNIASVTGRRGCGKSGGQAQICI